MNRETILRILDLARWAPSGDNTQPWRFEIVADDQVIVHGFDTRDHVIYDFEGHASHLAHGALLETMSIAASGFGVSMTWDSHSDADLRRPRYVIKFVNTPGNPVSPLYPFIEQRVVQRRPMHGKLTPERKQAILASVGDGFSVRIFESLGDRARIARLLWRNAHIRLTCPEAFKVHQSIIEWKARYSEDRIPERAVGVDPLTGRLMRWVMEDWNRVTFFNRYLLGTVPPRIQLDLLPALFCAGHILVERTAGPPASLDEWVKAGMVIQRIWLTVTQQGMYLQPEMTPVIFRWYVQAGTPLSSDPAINQSAKYLSEGFEKLADATQRTFFTFLCRTGECRQPFSRSLRLSLHKLMDRHIPYPPP